MSDPIVQSLQNPRIKQAVRLRTSRGRSRQQQFIIDGNREILRAVQSGVKLRELFVCTELLRESGREVLALCRDRQTPLCEVTSTVFSKLAFGERQEGLVAVADMVRRSLDDWTPPENALLAVLEDVEKPGNVGAVLRSADAAGVDAVILCGQCGDELNPNAIRASQGTAFRLPVLRAETPHVRQWLAAHHIEAVVTRVDATMVYTQAPLRGSRAIVLGSEADGVSKAWQGDDVTAVRIPMLGLADSLNVSVSAAVLFFEAQRQRTGEA